MSTTGKILGGILGGPITLLGDLLPSPPKPKPAPAAPDPNDPNILNAQRQKLAQAAMAGGRQSTILSSTGDYSSTRL